MFITRILFLLLFLPVSPPAIQQPWVKSHESLHRPARGDYLGPFWHISSKISRVKTRACDGPNGAEETIAADPRGRARRNERWLLAAVFFTVYHIVVLLNMSGTSVARRTSVLICILMNNYVNLIATDDLIPVVENSSCVAATGA